jgi:putative endonuclease
MARVYILYSRKLDKFYTGSSKELFFRIDQHFNKEMKDSFTAKADDWELFYSIIDLGYKQARSIETHIKKMKSKTYIENPKRYTEISDKLKLKYR